MTAAPPPGPPDAKPARPGFAFYFPSPSDNEGPRLAKQAIADATRQLLDDVVMLDAADAEPGALEDALAALQDVRRRLAGLPSLRTRDRSAGEWPAEELNQRARGPQVGLCNPLAPPVHLAQDGDEVTGWAVFGAPYEGGPGDVHGGTLAAVFDDVLGSSQLASPRAGRTGTLTVRYRSPTPLNQRIDFRGRVDRVEGRKVFVTGEAYHGETLCAEAEGIFVVPRGAVPPAP